MSRIFNKFFNYFKKLDDDALRLVVNDITSITDIERYTRIIKGSDVIIMSNYWDEIHITNTEISFHNKSMPEYSYYGPHVLRKFDKYFYIPNK